MFERFTDQCHQAVVLAVAVRAQIAAVAGPGQG
jgi:hypothetical protein